MPCRLPEYAPPRGEEFDAWRRRCGDILGKRGDNWFVRASASIRFVCEREFCRGYHLGVGNLER